MPIPVSQQTIDELTAQIAAAQSAVTGYENELAVNQKRVDDLTDILAGVELAP